MNAERGGSFLFELIMSFIFILMIQANVLAEIPVHTGQPSGEFFETWMLCGPFPNAAFPDGEKHHEEHLTQFETDYLADIGGESKLEISEGLKIDYPGGSAVWQKAEISGGVVNLDRAISDEEFALAYAYCEFESPREQACMLAVGSNDGVRVWLNGRQVYDRARGGKMVQDGDLIPVTIPEGRSALLLKIEERGGRWEFCCRLLPLDDRRFVVDRLNLFSVITKTDGVALFRATGAVPFWRELIKRVSIEVHPVGNPAEIIWKSEWNGEKEIQIPVKEKEFRNYALRLRALYMDNIERELAFPFAAGIPLQRVLFADGKSDYDIVVGEDASESERWAAMELQHWLKEISGIELLVRPDTGDPEEHEIIVGYNRHAHKLLGGSVTPPDDEDESFTYRNIDNNILIWGGKQRGTLHGVMTFLEREMGCRWYAPGASVAPKKTAYRFLSLNHSESPGIRVRYDDYFEARDPIWAARNKCNGAGAYRHQPGGVEVYYECHTFYKLMPPSEFFDSHPEYYSLIDGKRVHEQAELCLTNPDVIRIFTERVKKELRKYPQARIYSVSQNDWDGPCECENCQAIVDREGSQAGPVVWFANRIAENIEEEFPDRFIGTFAYDYTRHPPKHIKPRHNVVIRLMQYRVLFCASI